MNILSKLSMFCLSMNQNYNSKHDRLLAIYTVMHDRTLRHINDEVA